MYWAIVSNNHQTLDRYRVGTLTMYNVFAGMGLSNKYKINLRSSLVYTSKIEMSTQAIKVLIQLNQGGYSQPARPLILSKWLYCPSHILMLVMYAIYWYMNDAIWYIYGSSLLSFLGFFKPCCVCCEYCNIIQPVGQLPNREICWFPAKLVHSGSIHANEN